MNIDAYLSPYTTLSSKRISYISRTLDALNLIEKMVGNVFELLGTGKDFGQFTDSTDSLMNNNK